MCLEDISRHTTFYSIQYFYLQVYTFIAIKYTIFFVNGFAHILSERWSNMEHNQKKEMWDIYTKERIKTGKYQVRGNKFPQGAYHLVVHVCIFNSKNEMLIQKRQPFKEGWPNMWDLTVGGSAIAGESSTEAAEREVQEEIGLEIDLSDERPNFTINFTEGFDDYYIIKQDIDLSKLRFQKEEVQTVKWAGKEEVLKMYEEGTFIPYWFLNHLFEIESWNNHYRDLIKGIRIELATEQNLNSWMSLVEIVKDNFPGLETEEKMNTYRATVQKNMETKSAICALFGNMVVGILLFSVEKNVLGCLAVHPEFRRKHIATRMFELMQEKLNQNQTIVVETFQENDTLGKAPRAFYRKMGFIEGELCMFENQYPEQKFYLYGNGINKGNNENK